MFPENRRRGKGEGLGLVKEKRLGEDIKDRKLEVMASWDLKEGRPLCGGVCLNAALRTLSASLFRYHFSLFFLRYFVNLKGYFSF